MQGRMQGPMQDRILNGLRQRVAATTDDALMPVARDRETVACDMSGHVTSRNLDNV